MALLRVIVKPCAPPLRGCRATQSFYGGSTGWQRAGSPRYHLFRPLYGAWSGRRLSRRALCGSLDPRHRLLSSKYNPARTYTAEGTVGIGGMYMCIYGMDSPGGYQLVGRTLPIWNKFVKNSQFESDKPWLLRFFDQVKFHPVSEEELTAERESFRAGRSSIRISEEIFDWAAYREFLETNAGDIAERRARQAAAFRTEVAHWMQSEPAFSALSSSTASPEAEIPVGHQVSAQMHGSVWKVLVEPGERVEFKQVLLIIEAMKMEVAVLAPIAGVIKSTRCRAGQPVSAGDILAVIQ